MAMLKQLMVNVPLVEALEQMLGYAKFIKDLVMKKRVVSYKSVHNLHHCGAISTRSLVQNKVNPGAFSITYTIESLGFAKALYDLGVSINLMPLPVYKKLGQGDRIPTNMLYDVLVKHKEISGFSIVDVYFKDEKEVLIEEKFAVEPLAALLMNFDSEGIEEYEEII
ncbi:uncharacterized protein LOC124898508 [Capsicum annuum]|uniref:uncharacterized protein LOC124898508 n=1 Tax=Capsicum annuum TaxID=4072 RepID=UPI001FB18658|nr:uncharacterized protein LOC124898508 [Capsicum annuum]